ncbi:hypothetical protein PYW07_009591 [Mythimna separata]|uniref:ornithine decarboxylase n=1 Tax=Mythimna separata TaxID=271217 RepID=A0AAD8DNG5_MYTSE|nr:hypothetical protein PYW07_009591 [Mythimna separata]
MKVVEEQLITVMDGPWSPEGLIREIVESGTQEDPFYVMDLGEVVARYHRWKELMPRVEPFYAVKCNDDKLLVSTLAALGAGFDCASKVEIELVTSIGVAPERIIFANPAKMASHIRYASAVGVDVMTFDSENELMKIKQLMPHARLVIRIRCDAASAQFTLGVKFGCDPVTEAPSLLKLAAVLGLDIIGVSFHVGCGTTETAVYARAIALARNLFHTGRTAGHENMNLLDIGGGFPGDLHSSIREVAEVINSSLEEHFPEGSVRVISEPGTYFANAAYTLAAMVYAIRTVVPTERDEVAEAHTMYFINDGVYGSFNKVAHKQYVCAETVHDYGSPRSACSVWGPTCDGVDCVLSNTRLPALGVGDWLLFRDMGAYSLAIATRFNGFPVATVRHVIDARLACVLKERSPLSASQFVAAPAACCTADAQAECPAVPTPATTPYRAVLGQC